MEEQHYSHEYRTGRTQPQRNKNALITGLLICIIALAGLVSAMGLMNIRLVHLLQQMSGPETPPISFSQGDSAASVPTADCPPEASVTVADMTLVEVTALYQEIFDLPAGLYICQVTPHSPAATAGIAPGDVLIAVNGTPVTGLIHAEDLLSHQAPELTLSRCGSKIFVKLDTQE